MKIYTILNYPILIYKLRASGAIASAGESAKRCGGLARPAIATLFPSRADEFFIGSEDAK